MTNKEARRELMRVGFELTREMRDCDLWEYDGDIQVSLGRRNTGDDMATTGAVRTAIRRAEERKKQKDRDKPLSAHMGEMAIRKPVSYVPQVHRPFVPVLPKIVEPAPATQMEPGQRDNRGKRFGQAKRFALWQKIVGMRGKRMTFIDIAEELTRQGEKSPTGNPISVSYCYQAYRTFQKQRKLLSLPRGRKANGAPTEAVESPPPPPQPAPIRTLTSTLSRQVMAAPEVPDYVKLLLADDRLDPKKKVAAIRALHPTLPASVELMMDDPALSGDQKAAILAIVSTEDR